MARLRPSSAHRWVKCPASVQMQEAFPETEESEPAREGTAAHYVGEQVLISAQSTSLKLCSDFIGQFAPNGVMIDETMCDAANDYVMDVMKVCQAGGLLRSVQIEQGVKIGRVHATENEGTPDCWVFNSVNRTLDVWDFKYGFGIVEAFENWQLIDYAVGIIDQLGDSDLQLTVNIRIVQPRSYHADSTIRVWTVQASELRTYANELHHQGALALTDNPPAKSGEHCKNCSAFFSCQTAHRSSLNSIDVGGSMAIEVIPNDQLKLHRETLQRASKAIEQRLKAIDGQIEGLIEQGQIVDGLALDNPPGSLKWIKPEADILMMGQMLGVELGSIKLKTPTQCKKLIDEAVIKGYSAHSKSKTKIVNSENTKAAKVFSKQKVR